MAMLIGGNDVRPAIDGHVYPGPGAISMPKASATGRMPDEVGTARRSPRNEGARDRPRGRDPVQPLRLRQQRGARRRHGAGGSMKFVGVFRPDVDGSKLRPLVEQQGLVGARFNLAASDRQALGLGVERTLGLFRELDLVEVSAPPDAWRELAPKLQASGARGRSLRRLCRCADSTAASTPSTSPGWPAWTTHS
ncbi:MAG: hypothetical protein R3D28_21230 [Geminicoccaceae bacterium]